MSDTLFIYGEVELAEACGVAVKHFQRARTKNLRQGMDWDLNGLRVAYAKNAVPRVMDLALGTAVPAADCQAAMEMALLANGKKDGAREVEGLVRRFYLNPRLLGVELPDKALVNVRVKDTKNFRVGMIVPVRQVGEGRYELAKKLPRFPGRW